MAAALELEVRERSTGALLADRVRVAATHWTRLRGLLGTRELPDGAGLWILPCRQIHMFGMRYAIDAVFLDAEQRVVEIVESLRPGRASRRVAEAVSVLELPAGTVGRTALRPGTQLAVDGGPLPALAESRLVRSVGALAGNLLLSALYLLFALQHVGFARRTGDWATTMPLVLQESILVVLFLTRRRSTAVSERPLDWAVGIAGVFLPLLMRVTETSGTWLPLGQALQILGLSLAVVSVAFLGRSIGVVAAHRGIKTAGMYSLVRHPMYGAYMVSYVGYVLVHPSARNALIVATTLLALNVRAAVEERFLARDPAYDAYRRRIRWRFLPYVY